MNFSSGDFSLISNGAFLIKNGAIATSLEKVTFSKNLFDILKNIRIVGTDICRNTGSCDVSTVVINDIKFSS
jgi:predicted Zn-dependent protease